MGFTKKDSLIIKGAAIIAMIFHHCFPPTKQLVKYAISYYPFTTEQIGEFSAFLRAAAGLFAFISGYGLCVSLKEMIPGNSGFDGNKVSRWIYVRYIKTFSGYWFVIILCWIVTFLINRRPLEIYFANGKVIGFFYSVVDFFGLAYLFETPSLIGTWWYMSAAFAFIVAAPFLYWLLCNFGAFFAAAMLLMIPRIGEVSYPGNKDAYTFIMPFVMGMIFSRSDLINRLMNWISSSKKRYAAASAFSIIASVVCYIFSIRMPVQEYWDIRYGLFLPFYILFIILVPAKIPGLNTALQILGKHSANIFWTHNFLRVTYLNTFIYSPRHFILVPMLLLVLSLILSFILEGLKKVVHYHEIVSKCVRFAEKPS